MALSLKHAVAIKALAQCLYDFLPGSGAAQWGKGHITFGTVASQAGVGEFWQAEGSKLPRIIRLLEMTFTHRAQRFEPLIIAIVKEGLRYKSSKGAPIDGAEVTAINGHILDLGFKFPDLWDHEFLNALNLKDGDRAQENVARAHREQELKASARQQQARALADLKTDLEAIFVLDDRQAAGYRLEKLLNKLFAVAGLEPRKPFKVEGEQIDGSFVLADEVYLLEAKWEKRPLSEAPLLVFRGKVEGKSNATRGVFIAMNGVTAEAERAIVTGKQPNFFVMNGHDLMMVVQAALPLDQFFGRRQRLLAEEAAMFATFDRIAR